MQHATQIHTQSLAHLETDAHTNQNALSHTHTDMELFLVSDALKIHFYQLLRWNALVCKYRYSGE